MIKLSIIIFTLFCIQSCGLLYKGSKTIYRGRYNSERIVITKGNLGGLNYYRIIRKNENEKLKYWISFHLNLGPEADINYYAIEKNIYNNGKYLYKMRGMKNECSGEDEKQNACEKMLSQETSFLIFASNIIYRRDSLTLFTRVSVGQIKSWRKRKAE